MRKHLFDSDWRFRHGDEGQPSREFDDSQWRLLDLPHDWSIELPRRADCPSGGAGGFFEDGVGWYRKHFTPGPGWDGKRVLIEFEGVYRDAEIWLNGRHLGVHPYGYTSFLRDLTPMLRPGQDNVLALRVDNSTHRHTRWYSGSGVYRHVWLMVADPVHVAHWGLCVTTPEISEHQAALRVETRVENASDRDRPVTVRWKALDADGNAVAAGEGDAQVPAGGAATVSGQLSLPSPRLWSPDAPILYRLQADVCDGAGVLDTETVAFGVRAFSFTPEQGFVLNGEPLPLRGGCVHHDCGPLGAASIDRAEERKVELLKASGFNAVRCAHNPPAPAFLDACDRLGMLVIDEAFDVWRGGKCTYDYHRHFDKHWQDDLDSMLLRDRNHPSIVLWSIGNELIERALPEGAEIARKLAARVREVDSTRPVTAGICDIWGNEGEWRDTDGVLDALDVCGYNYRLDAYGPDHERCPHRVMIATESFPPQQFEYWKAVEELPHVAGDFVWTSLDYLGEAGIGRTFTAPAEEKGFHLPGWPWNQANCGDIDLCGFKRPQSYYRDVLWGLAKAPFIAVHPPSPEGVEVQVSSWGWHDVQQSWTWPGCEDRTLRVDVYFACDEVELFLNGESLGRAPATAQEKYTAQFSVPYQPGELKAVAHSGGKAVAEAVIATAGPAETIRLAADRATIRADVNDLAYVTAEVLDGEGRLVPTASPMLTFTLTGPGRLAAVASSDPRNTELYRGHSHSAWRGRCLAVIQPTGEPGLITLRAAADGLPLADTAVRAG